MEKGYSYFNCEKIFVECVKKAANPEVNAIGVVKSEATYSLVWSSFVK